MCKVRFAKWEDRPATAAQQCSRQEPPTHRARQVAQERRL
jgi:hypothetical protein